jgi:hypothetical protein
MKKILIICLLIFSGLNCFSQNYIDKIAQKACEYLETIPDSLSVEKYNMELGSKMVLAALPYKQELKRDYKIDLDNFGKDEGLKLGKLIGVKLVVFCPKALTRLTQRNQDEKLKSEENQKVISGTITSIDNTNFVIFSLKDEFERVYKFYWLPFVKADIDLANNYNSLVGKALKITYDKKDFFDPKIADYRSFNVIVKIESDK